MVVITKITAGGESGLQADVLTYRSGKLVKAVSIADTAMQERVFGTSSDYKTQSSPLASLIRRHTRRSAAWPIHQPERL